MVVALNLITVAELATEIKKQHHDSDLMRILLAALRERRVGLMEFCQLVKMLIGAPALDAIVMGLRVTQSLKKAQLQEREHQLASPVGSGSRPLRAPAGGPTPPSTTSTTAADASPAAAGGYADHAEVHSLSSLKRKVEVLQQANQRLDAENAVIKQKLAGKRVTRVLLDSSADATQRMLFKRMLLKRVLLERYDRA